MEEFKLTLCNICLNVKSDETFRVIEETTKDVLDILLLQGPIEINTSLICDACWTKVFEAFRFKTICIDTEDCIFPYVDSNNGAPVDLKEIYLKEIGEEELRSVSEEDRICRLCMQIVTSGFKTVKDIEMDLIRIYIPEVNFNSTEQPVVCTACLESLKMYGSFLGHCFNIPTWKENVSEDDVMEGQFVIKGEEFEMKYDEISECNETLVEDEPSDCQAKGKKDLRSLKGQKDERNTCDYQSDQEVQFIHQVQHKKASEVHAYQCDVCKFKTSCKEDLTSHLVIHKESSGVQMYKCDMCNFKSKYKRGISVHKLKHKSISELQMYKCDTCSYETKYKHSLSSHKLKHKSISEVQLYKCDMCNYESKHKGSLRCHQLLHKDSSEAQKYKCDWCNFEAKHRVTIRHHKLVHKGIPVCMCDTCNFEAKYKQSLSTHKLMHKDISEVQSYKCDMCNFETRYKRNMTNHYNLHASASKMQIYNCDACSFLTNCKRSLLGHQQRHKRTKRQMYKCDTCDFNTKHKKNLKPHQLLHKDISQVEKYECSAISQVQQFKCSLCNYETKSRGDITCHRLNHKGISKVQQFRCDMCCYKTKSKRKFFRHVLRHKQSHK